MAHAPPALPLVLPRSSYPWEYVGPHSSAPHAPGAPQHSWIPRQPARRPRD